MDVDLPVWTIRPNWRGGVLERLEWLTDVEASETGVEQRISVRLSPRRSFEITVNPTRAERTYLDMVLHRLGSEQWLFPLWHDQAALDVIGQIGQSAVLLDNTDREFRDGDYAILYGDVFTWEVVQIDGQTDDGLLLTAPLGKTWPRGTKVYPLRKARIQTDTSLKALTSRVGESVLLFQINEANDFPAMDEDEMPLYGGAPLLTIAPNRVQEIDTTHTRLFDEQDGQVGLVERLDQVRRAFSVQSHNWQISGRAAQAAFRRFLYTLRGRQRKVWLPTFNDDLFLAAPADKTAIVSIEKCGMSYVGGGSPIPGRARVWTGSEIALIGGVTAPVGTDTERLALTAPLTGSYASGGAWSFVQAARLDQDTIEIHHNADSNGTFEVAAGFKTFADVRDPSGSNFIELPDAVKGTQPCGVAEGDHEFKGWYWKVTWHVLRKSPNNDPHCMSFSSAFGDTIIPELTEIDYENWTITYYSNFDYAEGTRMVSITQLPSGCTPAGSYCTGTWPPEPAYCMAQLEMQKWNSDETIIGAQWQHSHGYPIDVVYYLGVQNLGGIPA